MVSKQRSYLYWLLFCWYLLLFGRTPSESINHPFFSIIIILFYHYHTHNSSTSIVSGHLIFKPICLLNIHKDEVRLTFNCVGLLFQFWIEEFGFKVDSRKNDKLGVRLLIHGQFVTSLIEFFFVIFLIFLSAFCVFFCSSNLWVYRIKKHIQQLYLEIGFNYISGVHVDGKQPITLFTPIKRVLVAFLIVCFAQFFIIFIFIFMCCALFLYFYSPFLIKCSRLILFIYIFFIFFCLLYHWWNSSDNESYKCMPTLIKIDKKISIV